MGRKKTRLQLKADERAEMLRLSRSLTSRRGRERLKTALKAAEGTHTLEDLAIMAGRSRSTIQNWLDKFAAGGVAGLLERNTPPGTVSPVGDVEIQKQLETGLISGRWQSAAQVASWLLETHGIRRARKSIYYWLHRNGWDSPHNRLRRQGHH